MWMFCELQNGTPSLGMTLINLIFSLCGPVSTLITSFLWRMRGSFGMPIYLLFPNHCIELLELFAEILLWNIYIKFCCVALSYWFMFSSLPFLQSRVNENMREKESVRGDEGTGRERWLRTWWLKTIQMYSPIILKVRSLKHISRAAFLLKVLGKKSASSPFLASGTFWNSWLLTPPYIFLASNKHLLIFLFLSLHHPIAYFWL